MNKIFKLDTFLEKIEPVRDLKIIGLTNGCFDLLHYGHIKSLEKAKHECEYLVVLLNSDSSVKQLKGENRPLIDEQARAYMLASLIFVDAVLIFNDTTPINFIKQIKPDIYFKGADYNLDELPEAKIVKSYGGKIMNLELIPNYSTTNLVNKIKNSN